MQYEPPPAFGPPGTRRGPLDPAQLRTNAAAMPAFSGGPPPPRGRRGRDGWNAVAVIGFVAVVALVTAVVVLLRADGGDRSASTSLRLPEQAGAFRLNQSVDGPTIRQLLGSQLGPMGTIQDSLDSALIGLYGRPPSSESTIVFIGMNATDSDEVRQLLDAGSGGSDAVIERLMSDAGANAPERVAPGPYGGTFECAHASKQGTVYTPCAWADRSTLGLVLQIGQVRLDDAAEVAHAFRAAAEH